MAACDVLIVGGGVAGLATAIHLRQSSSASVLVIEASDGSGERLGETVPPDIAVPLRRLGVEEMFRKSGHLPCPGSISLWGGARAGFNDFILNPWGTGWHLSRPTFEEVLLMRAQEVGAGIVRGARFAASRPTANGHLAHFRLADGGRTVDARWIVDACGPGARVARGFGGMRWVHDKLVAFASISTICSGEMTSQTLVESTRAGWWYAAQLPGRRVVRMFVTDQQGAKALQAGNFAAWEDQYATTELIAPALAGAVLSESIFMRRAVYSSLVAPAAGDGWLAVGDAASSYDPISSQGIYQALAGAEEVASAIAAELGGRASPMQTYSERVRLRFEGYLSQRADLYGAEQRWPDSAFWSGRGKANTATTSPTRA